MKGDKHTVSRVKTLAPVDVEKMENIAGFIEYALTPQRLQQGLDHLVNEMRLPLEITSMGDFIRWVFNDVIKEEADVMEASCVNKKMVGQQLAATARVWFQQQLTIAAMQEVA